MLRGSSYPWKSIHFICVSTTITLAFNHFITIKPEQMLLYVWQLVPLIICTKWCLKCLTDNLGLRSIATFVCYLHEQKPISRRTFYTTTREVSGGHATIGKLDNHRDHVKSKVYSMPMLLPIGIVYGLVRNNSCFP
jgi:hypothetical protein